MEVRKEKFKSAMQISDQGVSDVDFKNVPSLFHQEIFGIILTCLKYERLGEVGKSRSPR